MARYEADDRGFTTAEWASGTLTATAIALILGLIVVSDWFEKHLYRPFELALSYLF